MYNILLGNASHPSLGFVISRLLGGKKMIHDLKKWLGWHYRKPGSNSQKQPQGVVCLETFTFHQLQGHRKGAGEVSRGRFPCKCPQAKQDLKYHAAFILPVVWLWNLRLSWDTYKKWPPLIVAFAARTPCPFSLRICRKFPHFLLRLWTCATVHLCCSTLTMQLKSCTSPLAVKPKTWDSKKIPFIEITFHCIGYIQICCITGRTSCTEFFFFFTKCQ